MSTYQASFSVYLDTVSVDAIPVRISWWRLCKTEELGARPQFWIGTKTDKCFRIFHVGSGTRLNSKEWRQTFVGLTSQSVRPLSNWQ